MDQARILLIWQEGMGPEVGMTKGSPAERPMRSRILAMLAVRDAVLSKLRFPDADRLLWQPWQLLVMMPWISVE